MKNSSLIYLLLITSISALGISLFVAFYPKQEVVYFDLTKTYTSFEYTKQVEAEIKDVEFKRKALLDSLKFQIESFRMNNPEDKNTILQLESQYVAKRNIFDEDIQNFTSQSEDKIWKQLNSYVSEFGKHNEYKIILGANGTGNIMYGNPKNDISEEVIAYINDQFKGLK